MSLLTILVLVAVIFILIKDFRKDHGEHNKAKAIHAVAMVLLSAYYTGVFRYLGWFLGHIQEAQEMFGVPIGIFSGKINFFMFVLYVFVAPVVLVLIYAMVDRRNGARKALMWLAPLVVVIEGFNFHRGWFSEGDDLMFSSGLVMLIGLAFFGVLAGIFVVVYRANFMREFFEAKRERETEESKTVDSLE